MNCIVEKNALCFNFYPPTIIIFHITGNYFRTQKDSNIAKLLFGLFGAEHRIKMQDGKN